MQSGVSRRVPTQHGTGPGPGHGRKEASVGRPAAKLTCGNASSVKHIRTRASSTSIACASIASPLPIRQ